MRKAQDLKNKIGRALLTNVLDEAEQGSQGSRGAYNSLVQAMAKSTYDQKIRNKFTIDYIMSKFTTVKLKLV